MVNLLRWPVNQKELNAVIKMNNALVMALTLGVAMINFSVPVIFNSMLKTNQPKVPFYVILSKEQW